MSLFYLSQHFFAKELLIVKKTNMILLCIYLCSAANASRNVNTSKNFHFLATLAAEPLFLYLSSLLFLIYVSRSVRHRVFQKSPIVEIVFNKSSIKSRIALINQARNQVLSKGDSFFKYCNSRYEMQKGLWCGERGHPFPRYKI